MLFRKMLRDMKNNKMQFVSIFIMAFLGVFIYIGIGAEWYGIQQVYNSYFEETEMADAWVYGENMTDRDVRDILRVEGVTAAENRLTIKTIGDFGNKPEITLSYIGDEEISNMVIVSGKEYDSSIDGIWFDDNFAKAKRLEVGDEIVTIGGIIGRVVVLKEDNVVIETGSDRSKMRIARWAIQANNTVHDDAE